MAETLHDAQQRADTRTVSLEKPDPRGALAHAPPDPVPVEQVAPAKVAGGAAAIASTVRHALGRAGLIRGTRLLRRLNQFDGYDCPGGA